MPQCSTQRPSRGPTHSTEMCSICTTLVRVPAARTDGTNRSLNPRYTCENFNEAPSTSRAFSKSCPIQSEAPLSRNSPRCQPSTSSCTILSRGIHAVVTSCQNFGAWYPELPAFDQNHSVRTTEHVVLVSKARTLACGGRTCPARKAEGPEEMTPRQWWQ